MNNNIKNEGIESISDIFGEDVFSIKTMRNYLSEKAYKSLSTTIRERISLEPAIADEIADAMKTWAISKGATHYTHWFQPLTGATAEKHDSFVMPDNEGGVMLKFSGKELIQGEPDASSFPSGGLRVTFEARGYTAWDPTSPAFIKRGDSGAILCIPTVFIGYHGEALDKKAPLLRSMDALSEQVCRLARLFGIDTKGKRAYATLGAEQEYFLIDEDHYYLRPDLVQTGRTLFGKKPAKHQQLEDHYFGAIKPRVIAFMEDLNTELWKLGIPAKTQHNEVAPAQFELAPVFEELNLSVDHNMITMQTLREVAEQHGFKCLMHEKPYAGVNGSGKHNNWAIAGPDGKNWLSPGETPHENAKFLTVICALIRAVDVGAHMLRATVATAGNDHRLGANEAPPAIISIFLGEQLTEIIDQIEKGGAKSSKQGGEIKIGVTSLPTLPRDVTDRNRTSPFAFTGNKFEFRAVGSNQSCAGANITINTIVADSLSLICDELEAAKKDGKDFNKTLQSILSKIIKKHKRILFNGDNYTDAWKKEAQKRGLPNLLTTPESIAAVENDKELIDLFSRHGVLSPVEFKARNEVYKEAYEKTVYMEANCAVHIAKTMIIPVAIDYQGALSDTIKSVHSVSAKISQKEIKGILNAVVENTEKAITAANELDKLVATHKPTKNVLKLMGELREAVDELEGLLPDENWPLPNYAEMLFVY
ncbi:MAG: glutamine synthetase III [Candidatus Omnitrophica bacterium]|nr:glutamine synthetase III [Candidatus Omnitrophota bacterium]